MDNAIRVFSGRTFSPADLETIKWARRTYPGLSRTELAATVCELLEWTMPAGQPKRLQCIKLFEQLEAEGIVQLPPVRAGRYTGMYPLPQVQFNTKEISGETREYEPISLEIARQGQALTQWRSRNLKSPYMPIRCLKGRCRKTSHIYCREPSVAEYRRLLIARHIHRLKKHSS